MKATWSRLLPVAAIALGMTGFISVQPTYASVSACPADESALSSAIASAGTGGTVIFDCTAATTIPFTSTITISHSVTLDGRTSAPVKFDGGNTAQLFWVNSGTTFQVIGLTLARGHASTTDTYNSSYGGAMKSFGTVTISDSTLVDNSATSGAGAIYNGGTLTIHNSTVVRNKAQQNGGALYNNGTASVTNSTLADNSGTGGGAIYTPSGFMTTVAGSILFHNGLDCNAPVVDGGYNLINNNSSANSCGLNGSTDIWWTDPFLKALAKNGGPTETMALSADSQAVDHISASSGLCPATDQRGVTRLDDSETACDIGAYEHVDHLRIAITVASGVYSVHVDGATLEPGSVVDWRAKTPHGDHSGTIPVDSTGIVHQVVFSHACQSEHITVDASGREVTAAGTNDVTAHYEGDPC